MAEAGFTKGPWDASRAADSYEQRQVYGSDHEHVANVINGSAIPGRTTANARLIAAAPDLYEALANVLTARGAPGRDEYLTEEAFKEANAAHSAARAALLKAGGSK